MKVCTVLVSTTSKRPIKLLSHADRQKSDAEGRTGKKPRRSPRVRLGTAAGGAGRGRGSPARPGAARCCRARSPTQPRRDRGSGAGERDAAAAALHRLPAPQNTAGEAEELRGKKGTVYHPSLLVELTAHAGTGRHGSTLGAARSGSSRVPSAGCSAGTSSHCSARLRPRATAEPAAPTGNGPSLCQGSRAPRLLLRNVGTAAPNPPSRRGESLHPAATGALGRVLGSAGRPLCHAG